MYKIKLIEEKPVPAKARAMSGHQVPEIGTEVSTPALAFQEWRSALALSRLIRRS